MKLFNKKIKTKKWLPTWNEIVIAMHDKMLSYDDNYHIIDVIYSTNNEHRFVILKKDDSYLTYTFESLVAFDEESFLYTSSDDYAYWQPKYYDTNSIFDDINILMRELKATPEYKTYFNKDKN